MLHAVGRMLPWILVIALIAMFLGIDPFVGPPLFLVVCLVWLWMLRQFGLLSVLVTFSLLATRSMPFVLTGWLATRSIVLNAIPVLIAAAALWAVLAAQPHRAAEPVHEG